MSTTTSTITTTVYSTKGPIKSTMKSTLPVPVAPLSSTSASLRSLYNTATRAFLHKDITLTHSLIQTAFQSIHAPALVHDLLAEHRRKWDILRITLETTVYADPPAIDSIPPPLRANMTESPQTLMWNIYGRSLALFTPTSGSSAEKGSPDVAYLPPTVLHTLLWSSLKIDCADVGRMMAEQWMSRRELPLVLNSANSTGNTEEEGYDKVVEIYALHILPKLDQWDYAKEFLQFEGELLEARREFFKSRLNAMHAEALAVRKPISTPPSPSSTPTPRSHSPAPSSSSSSSMSTTSTHTVVPSTPKGSSGFRPAPMTAISDSSKASSDGTATPRGRQAELPTTNGNAHSRSQTRRTASSAASSSSALSSGPRTTLFPTPTTSTTTPTILSLIKASLAPHLTTSKVTTFLLLFVLFPLVSWVLRIRHRRRMISGGAASNSPNVDLVRRRLQVARASDANLVTRLWKGSLRAVLDTVKMAGSGLV